MHVPDRGRSARTRLALGVAATLITALLLSGCGLGGQPGVATGGSVAGRPPPATANPTVEAGPPAIDGVPCQIEAGNLHYHAHLELLQEGRQIALPGTIGRTRHNCVYLAHTHSLDGIIHVQAELDTPYLTLGQFFAIWGRPLTRHVAADLESPAGLNFYVDGVEFSGDPYNIELVRHRDIVIEAGPLRRPEPYLFAPGT